MVLTLVGSQGLVLRPPVALSRACALAVTLKARTDTSLPSVPDFESQKNCRKKLTVF